MPTGMLSSKTHGQPTRGRDHAADGRPHDRGHAPDGREDSLHAGPLAGLEDVTGNREGDRLNRPRAEALDRPEGDQLEHGPGQAAQRRARHEQQQAEQEHRLASVDVGQPGIQRHGGRGREQVRAEDPCVFGEAAKLADDRRHRRPHDRGVERGHRERGHEADGDEPLLARDRGDGRRGLPARRQRLDPRRHRRRRGRRRWHQRSVSAAPGAGWAGVAPGPGRGSLRVRAGAGPGPGRPADRMGAPPGGRVPGLGHGRMAAGACSSSSLLQCPPAPVSYQIPAPRALSISDTARRGPPGPRCPPPHAHDRRFISGSRAFRDRRAG